MDIPAVAKVKGAPLPSPAIFWCELRKRGKLGFNSLCGGDSREVAMFGRGNYKERMKEEFYEDRSMAFSGSDEWEDLERFIDRCEEDGEDMSEVSLEELKQRKDDAEW
jgi:hypothetical protein